MKKTRRGPSEHALEVTGSTTMDSELQGMRGADVRQNGEGVNHGVERNHAEGAYPCREQEQAPLSSVNRRRSEGERQVRGVIWPERRWSGGGVRCQSTGSGQLGRWPDGVPDAKRNRRPRGEASLYGRQREVEGKAGKRARHGSDSKRRARVLVKWIGAPRRILFERL